MRKIVVSEFISMDGVIEAPHHWHFPYVTEDMGADIMGGMSGADVFLMGRVTYEEFAPHWSTQSNDDPLAAKLNNTPKYVVSTTLQSADWSNSILIKDNVAAEVAKLKQSGDGDISMTGSATLIQSLMQHGLVDEVTLMVHPIVVGKGKRLFSDTMNTQGWKLIEAKPYQGGVVSMRYHVVSTQ